MIGMVYTGIRRFGSTDANSIAAVLWARNTSTRYSRGTP